MLRALLLAPPGAGKGTQGERLAEIYGVPHVSTGDLLRANVEEGTPLGDEAKALMLRGELLPDRVVMNLVLDQIADHAPLDGFVLDGFPRSIQQAELASKWGAMFGRTFHAVIYLDVPEDELVERLIMRGIEEGRGDDEAETIRRRLRVYRESTEPLLDYYLERGVLVSVDGTGPIEEVTERILERLSKIDVDRPSPSERE